MQPFCTGALQCGKFVFLWPYCYLLMLLKSITPAMPTNKNAQLRYKVIDRALREAFNAGENGVSTKRLMEMIAEEFNGSAGPWDHKKQRFFYGVSLRTFRNDLEAMKQMGAPIELEQYGKDDYRYFYYKAFALGDSLGKDEMNRLYRAQAALAQLGLSGLSESIGEMLEIAREKLNATKLPQGFPLQLEDRELVGMEHITPLFDCIAGKEKFDLLIRYRPYGEEPVTKEVRPLFLKEFNRRWYLIAMNRKSKEIHNLALDRMEEIKETIFPNLKTPDLEKVARRYREVIGVTLPAEEDHPEDVLLRLKPKRAPYVLTKPLHGSQETVEESAEGTTIKLRVILNKELEARILELGRDAEVLSPARFRERIKNILQGALKQY